MYKGSSDGAQRHLHRLTTLDQVKNAGATALPEKEREAQLKNILYDIDNRLAKLPKNSSLRKQLAKQKANLQEIRRADKSAKQGHAIDYVRVWSMFGALVAERYGENERKAIMREAQERYASERGLTHDELFKQNTPVPMVSE